MKWSWVALGFVFVVCIPRAFRYITPPSMADFAVYETAATLVREHRSLLIYDGADRGTDPQLRFADTHSAFGRTAQQLGLPAVRMYVYPPTLADLLTPLSLMGARRAARVWTGFNILLIGVVAWMCLALLEVPFKSVGTVVLTMGLLVYDPIPYCIYWGQITLLLLALWTGGILAYSRGLTRMSAFVLALAAMIKLTPLVAVVPFVLWRKWRWLRAYAISLAAVTAGLFVINGQACLLDCLQHVLPAMSGGVPSLANRSVLAACQLLYMSFKGITFADSALLIPHAVNTAGKLLGFGCIAIVALLAVHDRKAGQKRERALILAAFAMLSALIAPVSWVHAFAVGFPLLAMLWAEALRREVPVPFLVLLTACSLELNWFALSSVVRQHTHGLAFGLAAFLPALLGMALMVYRLLLANSAVATAVEAAGTSTASMTDEPGSTRQAA